MFRLEGEYWTIVFRGRLIRLRDSRGLRYLANLLRHPGRPIPAVELVATADGSRRPRPLPSEGKFAARDREVERARLTVTKGIRASLERIAAAHPSLAAHLHATVRRGYVCVYTPDPQSRVAWED